MKRPAAITVLLFTMLFAAVRSRAIPDFANAIRYTPPPSYGTFELKHDPGDDPFSGKGPGLMLLANDQKERVLLRHKERGTVHKHEPDQHGDYQPSVTLEEGKFLDPNLDVVISK